MDGPWYYAQAGMQFGPVTEEALQQLAVAGRLRPTDLVWRSGMADWQPAGQVRGLFPPPGSPGAPPPPLPPAMDSSKRIAAGVCGVLLGSLGVHKFILGYTLPGIIMLLASLVGSWFTCGLTAGAMHLIGLIEGIIYLSKTDEDFYRTYVLARREWF